MTRTVTIAGDAKPNKFGARKVQLDGYTFDSVAEATRYQTLKWSADAGLIADLRIHPAYTLEVNGEKVGTFKPDFVYVGDTGDFVEDVKSKPTAAGEAFRLRARLFFACHGLRVHCVTAKGEVFDTVPAPPKPKKTPAPRGKKETT